MAGGLSSLAVGQEITVPNHGSSGAKCLAPARCCYHNTKNLGITPCVYSVCIECKWPKTDLLEPSAFTRSKDLKNR